MRRLKVDLTVVAAAAVAVVMTVAYLVLMRSESQGPAWWYVGALVVGAVAAGYGASTGAPHRQAALVVAGVVLVLSGFLGILSVGLPVLLGGIACVVAAARASTEPPVTPRTRAAQ